MSLVVREELTAGEVAAVLEVTDEAAEADGVRPVGESPLLGLRDGATGALLAYEGDTLAGVAVVDGDAAEIAVRPALRRRGHGRTLASALSGRVQNVWAHGELPGAVALAGELGFERFRALWKMRRPFTRDDDLPAVSSPPGVRLRTFEPGRDEDAWVRLNARAFVHHPEQGRWTRADLLRREREPWFDPSGFFLAEREPQHETGEAGEAGDGGAGELLGFHWTKVHDDGPIGEVYVVGVDPDAQGLGLGRVLTLAGLRHLRDGGLPAVMLYVDESNTAATALYGKLGFTRWSTDAMYTVPSRTRPN